jgi:hypothetical protein
MGIRLTSTNFWTAGILDIALIAIAGVSLWQASAASYEWLLILFLAGPTLAFVLVLGDLPASA